MPVFHSKPGAARVIYLDYDGHATPSTSAWGSLSAAAFDIDSNPSAFGPSEVEVITTSWGRVAEDFAPFDVDVTTEEPNPYTSTVLRVVITLSRQTNLAYMPFGATAGGVAFLGALYTEPCWVYYDNLQNRNGRGPTRAGAGHGRSVHCSPP